MAARRVPHVGEGWFPPHCIGTLTASQIEAPTVYPVAMPAAMASEWYWLADRVQIDLSWTGRTTKSGTQIVTRDALPNWCGAVVMDLGAQFIFDNTDTGPTEVSVHVRMFDDFQRGPSDTHELVRPRIDIVAQWGGFFPDENWEAGAGNLFTSRDEPEATLGRATAILGDGDGVEVPLYVWTTLVQPSLRITPLFP